MTGTRRAAVLALALCAFAAHAHIVYGTKTLRGLVAEADLVIHARIVATGEPVAVTTDKGNASRPTVDAEVLEVLKGSYDEKRIRFAQHGHGVAPFEPRSETLLFLVDIARSRELAALGRTGTLSWVSLQEHDDRYPVDQTNRKLLLRAIRKYVTAGTAEAPEEREAALRRATRDLITSGDTKLAASAVSDLAGRSDGSGVTSEDLPVLMGVFEDPETAIGVRVGVLVELQRRELVDAPALWLKLLSEDETPDRDRLTAIRAAGASAGPSVRPRLIELLQDPSSHVAAAAARALGTPGNAEAVEPLGTAIATELTEDSRRIRNASIRALGVIGTPAAYKVLEEAAESHPDQWTRVRAGRELRNRTSGKAGY